MKAYLIINLIILIYIINIDIFWINLIKLQCTWFLEMRELYSFLDGGITQLLIPINPRRLIYLTIVNEVHVPPMVYESG